MLYRPIFDCLDQPSFLLGRQWRWVFGVDLGRHFPSQASEASQLQLVTAKDVDLGGREMHVCCLIWKICSANYEAIV